jgi:fructan beta-fructosidase
MDGSRATRRVFLSSALSTAAVAAMPTSLFAKDEQILLAQSSTPQTAVTGTPEPSVDSHQSFDLSPELVADQQNYDQPLRPQFHYTTIQGHIGDTTGLVSYKGEYHLFNIHDEWARKNSVHKRWAHAISTDLVHWKQLPTLLDTVIDHSPGSGSGVVDWNNSSGLSKGQEKALLVFYTDYQRGSCIVYSNDRGRTWIRYAHNPVIAGANDARDPNVFWYVPASEWRMVRYENKGFAFYQSQDLIHWTWLSRVEGYYECPDLFELPVVNATGERRWVLIDGNGTYTLGMFNGHQFIPETEKLKAEYAPVLYATQTWKHPFEDTGVYQVAWMRYPAQPELTWNGQVSFPVRLSLRRFPEGIRLCREPINEIDNLRVSQQSWKDLKVNSEKRSIPELRADLLDLRAEIKSVGAEEFGITVRGQIISYSVAQQTLQLGSLSAPLKLPEGTLRLRILVDRSSIEVFADEGEVTFSVMTLEDADHDVSLFSNGGEIRVVSLEANRLESIWRSSGAAQNCVI